MIRKSSFSRGSRLDAAPSVAVVAPPAPRRGRFSRGCTDCPCLLLFFATLGGLGYVAFLSLQPPSDFRRVLYGLDSQHDLCGVDNRVETTGEPRDVTVTFRPSAFRRLWPFGETDEERNITVRRGARDHTTRPLLYFTYPSVPIPGMPAAAAVCVSECPRPPRPNQGNASSDATTSALLYDPSEWVCTGRHYGVAKDRCGGTVDETCPLPNASTLFSNISAEALDTCSWSSDTWDPMVECDVCYPPYRTVQLGTYCLPDPESALGTVATLLTAFGAVGKAAGNDGQLSLTDLDQMRSFVSTAPHLIWEDLVLSAPVIGACIGFAFAFGFVWMLLVRFFAHLMVWGTVLSLGGGCGIGAYFMWMTAYNMKQSIKYAPAIMSCRRPPIPLPPFSLTTSPCFCAFENTGTAPTRSTPTTPISSITPSLVWPV